MLGEKFELLFELCVYVQCAYVWVRERERDAYEESKRWIAPRFYYGLQFLFVSFTQCSDYSLAKQVEKKSHVKQ